MSKIKKTIVGIMLALGLVAASMIAGAPANALSHRLDNWSGYSIMMRSYFPAYGFVYESVPHGSAGDEVAAFRVPATKCVRITYRDGWAANYRAGTTSYYVNTRNVDGYLSRC